MFCCVQIYLISPRTAFVFKTAKCQLRHYQRAQALASVGRAAPGARAAAAGVSSMSHSRTLLPPKQQVDDLQDPQYGQERLCGTAAACGRWWSRAVRQQHRRAPGRVLLAAILSSLAARPRLALTQQRMSKLPQTRLVILISSRTALSWVCVPRRGAGPALCGLAAALCCTAGSMPLSPRPSQGHPWRRCRTADQKLTPSAHPKGEKAIPGISCARFYVFPVFFITTDIFCLAHHFLASVQPSPQLLRATTSCRTVTEIAYCTKATFHIPGCSPPNFPHS